MKFSQYLPLLLIPTVFAAQVPPAEVEVAVGEDHTNITITGEETLFNNAEGVQIHECQVQWNLRMEAGYKDDIILKCNEGQLALIQKIVQSIVQLEWISSNLGTSIGEFVLGFQKYGLDSLILEPDSPLAPVVTVEEIAMTMDLEDLETDMHYAGCGAHDQDCSLLAQEKAFEESCVETVIDFDTDGLGNPTSKGDLVADMYANLGISITSSLADKPTMLFDSANPTGGDFDLGTDTEGMVMIISEDKDANDPDDNGSGGYITMTFASPVCFRSVGLLDMQRSGSWMEFYDADDNELVEQVQLPTVPDNTVERVDFEDLCDVSRIEIRMKGAGAFTEFVFCTPPVSTGRRSLLIEQSDAEALQLKNEERYEQKQRARAQRILELNSGSSEGWEPIGNHRNLELDCGLQGSCKGGHWCCQICSHCTQRRNLRTQKSWQRVLQAEQSNGVAVRTYGGDNLTAKQLDMIDRFEVRVEGEIRRQLAHIARLPGAAPCLGLHNELEIDFTRNFYEYI